MKARIEEDRITERLAAIPPWTRVGDSLENTFQLSGFPQAIAFVNRVAELAEQANHHPDIQIRWNKVSLSLSTHSAGGLTELDFELAAQILSAAAAMGAD